MSTPSFQQAATSFGADAERYDRTRPRYPAELIAAIAAGGPDIVDAGCGTGILARQLTRAGCRVLGVEKDERMAVYARTRGTPVEVAAIEDWDPAGRTFGALTSGQTWHWVDPVRGATAAARIVRPGGRVWLCWNVHQPPPELAAAFTAVYRRVLPDLPIFDRVMPALEGYEPIFEAATGGLRAAGAFEPVERRRYDWTHHYSRAGWLDQVPTHGGHSHFSPAQLTAVLDGVGAAIGDGFTMVYTTVAITTSRS